MIDVYISLENKAKLIEIKEARNKGKSKDEQINAYDLIEDILARGIEREYNILKEREAQEKNKIKIMREYVEITNEILSRSKINFTVFITKDGYIRIKDRDENVVLRGDDGRILSGRVAVNWLDDEVLTLNDNGCYPKTTEEETKRYKELSQTLIEWKYRK